MAEVEQAETPELQAPDKADEAERLKSLAAWVIVDREDMQLSVSAAARRGGLDTRTWQRVERGQPVRAAGYDAVDRGLGWVEGASRAHLAGEVDMPSSYVDPASLGPQDELGPLVEAVKQLHVASLAIQVAVERLKQDRVLAARRAVS